MRKLLVKFLLAIVFAVACLIIQFFASIYFPNSNLEQFFLLIFTPLFKAFEGYLTPHEILDLIWRLFEMLIDWLIG